MICLASFGYCIVVRVFGCLLGRQNNSSHVGDECCIQFVLTVSEGMVNLNRIWHEHPLFQLICIDAAFSTKQGVHGLIGHLEVNTKASLQTLTGAYLEELFGAVYCSLVITGSQ